MNTNTELCERVRMAALAMEDGEDPGMAAGEIEGHIRSCDGCRRELAGLRGSVELLMRSRRKSGSVDLWPLVKQELAGAPERKPAPLDLRGLLIAVVLFACYKAIELVMPADPAPLFRLAPLVIGVLLFFYLRNNPFRIYPGLRLEGEYIS